MHFATIPSWGVSLGKGRDTARVWPGLRGWAQFLARSRTAGKPVRLCLWGEFTVGRIHCHRGVLSCTAFSLWVNGCSQEQLLNWDLSNTPPHWKGIPQEGGSLAAYGSCWCVSLAETCFSNQDTFMSVQQDILSPVVPASKC